MALAKRGLQFCDEQHHIKRARVSESEPCQCPGGYVRVVLNSADCDIDFNVAGNGLQGSALYEDGFAYCWSGARANMGITNGKYYFGCKIISAEAVKMEDTPLGQQHLCRVGISRGDDSVRNLGETPHSFGFGGTGKFSNSGNFFGYGEEFGVGDTIVCYIDLESLPMASISFSKNGKWLGIAKHFDAGPSGLGVCGSPMKNVQWESALFPHVLLKNVIVQLQFTIDDGLVPVQGYKPWATAFPDGNAVLGPSFSNPAECEVIMMVGLPASGKTTWAEKFVVEHPEKRYVLLGTNLALEQMKVPGLLRKHNYGERFDRLMDHATKIFNVLLSRASQIPRNFIIDQTNVYKSARKRKLKPFANYIKIAAVVFPRPEELKSRADKRFKEMGKEVPAEAVNQMLANYTLPMSKGMRMADEYFDQVLFVELTRVESQKLLDEMKRDLQAAPSLSLHPHRSSRISWLPDQSSSSSSFQNQGVGDPYSSSWPPYHSRTFDSDVLIGNPRNPYDERLGNGPGGYRQYNLPASRHSTPLFSHGSYGTQISRPPLPIDMLHGNPWSGASMHDSRMDVLPDVGAYPQPRYGLHVRACPQPPQSYQHMDAAHQLPPFRRGPRLHSAYNENIQS